MKQWKQQEKFKMKQEIKVLILYYKRKNKNISRKPW